MRRLLPLLLAALAACQVDVEGAPCEIADHCPSGQGCGLDHRCSKRAASAGCAHCTPGERRCGDGKIEECSAATDPVCGAWVPTTHCQDGLVCSTSSGAPACECPPPAGQFAVAAPGSVAFSGPAPTGALEPPQCRFPTLTEALAVAAEAGGGTVIATGGTAGMPPVVFGAATGETLPIDIKSGVTLTTDVSSSGASYAIQLDDPATASAVKLHAGAALTNFAIENVAGDSTRDAIVLACDDTNVPVHLDRVTLRGDGADAEHQLKRGLHVNGTCGVNATDVVITGMQLEALRVEARNAAVESTFLRGALERSGRGIQLKQGVLKLDGVRVDGNAGKGIEVDSSGDTAIELSAVRILGNGDTGLAVMNATRLSVLDSTIFGNGIGTSPTVWGPPDYPNSSGTARRCGGVVLVGAPPPNGAEPSFRFERNRVYSNRGDQVLVMLSSGATWPLGGAACGTTNAETTVFGCYDSSNSGSTVSYRGLVLIDARVDATRIAWNTGVAYPGGNTDYKEFGVSSAPPVVTPFCALSAVLDCSSPEPK